MTSAKRGLGLVCAAGLATLAVFAAPAQGGPRTDPIAHAACDVAPCSTPDNITAPAGGSAIETLPVPVALAGVIVVKPAQPKPAPSSAGFFNQLQTVLSGLPNTHARILACIAGTLSFVTYQPQDEPPVDVSQKVATATLFMEVCLATVGELQPTPKQAADSAAGPCHQFALSVGVHTTRVGNHYQVKTNGKVRRARGLPGLRVSCRRLSAGLGYQISFRPTRRGERLRQAIGPIMEIGIVNRSTRSVPLHTVVMFR